MSVFLGAIKSEKVSIIDFYSKKVYEFKKVNSLRDIPRNARRFHDLWTIEKGQNELYELFRTPAGVIYGYKRKIS
jgi:hypothetical protein